MPPPSHNHDNQIAFYFKKDDKPPRTLNPLIKPSEAVSNYPTLSAFPPTPSLNPTHRLQPIHKTHPTSGRGKQRQLVVRMPTVAYPRALSPPMAQQQNGESAISNSKRVSFLPPIAVQHNVDADDEDSVSETSGDNRMLLVPDTTPDPKFESNELQHRLSIDKAPIRVTYRKPARLNTSRSASEKPAAEKLPNPKYLRYVNKHKSLYNSWEGGLHSYHIDEEIDDDDNEEPLTFRLKMRHFDESYKPKKKPKTPPKDPFKESILADIDCRRKNKVKAAVGLSTSGDLIKGRPVVENPPSTAELMDKQRGSQGFHRIQQLNLPGEYRSARSETNSTILFHGSSKGSALFQKKKDEDKVPRPFDPQPDQTPRLLTGKTIMRNPLSPIPLKHRYNPVVVIKSKLDDYTGAIKDFLEQVVEEQRLAGYDKNPLPLSQSIENMVIYKDFDTIQYFKAMQRQLVNSKQHTHDLQKAQQYNFKAPASNVAKGVANVQKLGARHSGEQLEPLPRSGLKTRGVVGHSVFLTNPQGVESPSGQAQTVQKLLLLSAGFGTPTSAPPNTPHAGRLY